ncbi:hypothetical protein GGTG_13272 [Gaeumannomyces tritici R3-111a-1]|uniref:Uncharacterized protein n=1 Tax=Gaeumannomyces tritici (strain R3-111a-1) TaxID=644352 RepID=J3PIE4_GAET3|nr:hypothetical protein GGTG_13272 [Gaeumannomyces tritici R3-111a-1]EJT69163.1 hypothetical protein GGTG_13272 [Gaeumannomyces tritici R3-111a-1]
MQIDARFYAQRPVCGNTRQFFVNAFKAHFEIWETLWLYIHGCAARVKAFLGVAGCFVTRYKAPVTPAKVVILGPARASLGVSAPLRQKATLFKLAARFHLPIRLFRLVARFSPRKSATEPPAKPQQTFATQQNPYAAEHQDLDNPAQNTISHDNAIEAIIDFFRRQNHQPKDTEGAKNSKNRKPVRSGNKVWILFELLGGQPDLHRLQHQGNENGRGSQPREIATGHYRAVAESTPPPRPAPSSLQQTPWLHHTGSSANSSEFRHNVDRVLRSEVEPLYVGVSDFCEKNFGPVAGLPAASAAILKKCTEDSSPLFGNKGWRGGRQGPKRATCWHLQKITGRTNASTKTTGAA